jgi:hypothetical protein
MYNFLVIGGNPDGNGGGIITAAPTRYEADRLAAQYVTKGYRDVRVVTYDEFLR